MKKALRGALLATVLILLPAAQAKAQDEVGVASLQPYQMVRSLQRLQDRLADGDHAALPMQKKLLELTDDRLRTAIDDDFKDRRNLQALLIYAMSGGNPQTVETLLKRLPLEPEDQLLARGVEAYAKGQMRLAAEILIPFDIANVHEEVRPFLLIVQGGLRAAETPADALKLYDRARYLSPGTLIEEAALRRTIDLTVALQQPQRFERVAEQYIRRFIRSPYSSQFIDAYMSGVVKLHGQIDLDILAETVELLTLEQQRYVYLKLARISALDHLDDLNVFASAKAAGFSDEIGKNDPRIALYANVSSVTSETVADVLQQLENIDQSRLSGSDRELLDAAKAIAVNVTTLPPQIEQSILSVLPEPEISDDNNPASHRPDTVNQTGPETASASPSEEPPPSSSLAPEEKRHMTLVSNTREKLQAIDAMLDGSSKR